ncbi:MAG TPA: ABC transporter permease [Candidatus Pullichristensenella excrementigallinarum]|uniref:ABC transporter permease n=1 Tax=Candidatus Pullichristensenella excrementigallinarum TaxID=2840907 RepID=A0A9D1ICA0_9FIRM|nr:ABC transporter permease [Candidatus Pullichristensenella excrementigallinarum]
MKFLKKPGAVSCMASLLSILAGILFGFLLLIAFNPSHALSGLVNMTTNGIANSDKLAKVFYMATPLMMTGLSVAFAFKTGLFNIGASGQYVVGAFMAIYGAVQWQLPWYACILLAMLGGAIWGSIPGICKAFFNVNEVITSIMFNWIGLYTVNLILLNSPAMFTNYYVPQAPNTPLTVSLKLANPEAILPKMGMNEWMQSEYINISIFLAILIAVVMWVILNKTTFGYELKACGFNRHASEYAGINARRNIVLSMTIAGALSGIGGALYYLSGTAQYEILKTALPAMGFNGIPVALLASSNPVGTIFSALFVSYIQVGGEALQPEYVKEIIDIIIAVIIYLSAFALLIRGWIGKLVTRRSLESEEKKLSPAGKKGGNTPC